MDIEDLEAEMQAMFGECIHLSKGKNGEVIVYTGHREHATGELVPIEGDDEESDDDEDDLNLDEDFDLGDEDE